MSAVYRVVAPGCEAWDDLAGSSHWSLSTRVAHTLYLIHGRYVRSVREVAPGLWRGLVGRRRTRTLEVRP